MKNIPFRILLLTASAFNVVLEASDQKYPFDKTDEMLFKVSSSDENNKRMNSLYSTAFINSISPESKTTIEKAPLFSLCKCAIAQTMKLSERSIDTAIEHAPFTPNIDGIKLLAKANDRADVANKRAHQAASLLGTLDDTVTIADQELLLLLQFSVRKVKRSAEKIEITLHDEKPKTLIATPLLAQCIDKYHAHENQDIVA